MESLYLQSSKQSTHPAQSPLAHGKEKFAKFLRVLFIWAYEWEEGDNGGWGEGGEYEMGRGNGWKKDNDTRKTN